MAVDLVIAETISPSCSNRGEVRVTDTGPGIPVAERRSVFEPYYRGAGAARAPGIGLGLAISWALVAQMGGELALESEVGVGSSFVIHLPSGAAR